MFAVLILMVLLHMSPFLEAAETEGHSNKTRSRQRRHYRDFKTMMGAMTRRPSGDFFYGNYCGLSNSGGVPVDRIDACCEMHDACYDMLYREPCSDFDDKNLLYSIEYKFTMDTDKTLIVCDESTKTNSRYRRSIMNLGDMVKAVTGREGEEFVPYGNYCGIGGEGQPVDPIDECCQNHDICYDIAKAAVCKDHGEKSIYQLEYKWHVADDETAVCEDEKDQCKMTICICDAIITNCIKSNIDFYDPQHKKDWDLYQLFEGMEAMSDTKK